LYISTVLLLGARPASYQTGNWGSYPGGKLAGS
jgi:hypothetical protein